MPEMRVCWLGILSDIHYASEAERARGDDYEYRDLKNPFGRWVVRLHRHYFWLRHPLHQAHRLDAFLERAGPFDQVIALGDYSCNSAFIGVSDDAACQSAGECLGKLRARYGPNFRAVFGDHELGKISLLGKRGGMRLASWRRALSDLHLEPFWTFEIGHYLLVAVVSSLVALPAIADDLLPEERVEWERLRSAHLECIRAVFAGLRPDQRVLLFCHDPTALPFLGREPVVQRGLDRIERTLIGHLHSNLILRQTRFLAGMPPIRFLGHTPKKLSLALRNARDWRPFKVLLCPALAGIQLLNDGGYLTAELDPTAERPARFVFCPLQVDPHRQPN
jgi:hypothetical protein